MALLSHGRSPHTVPATDMNECTSDIMLARNGVLEQGFRSCKELSPSINEVSRDLDFPGLLLYRCNCLCLISSDSLKPMLRVAGCRRLDGAGFD